MNKWNQYGGERNLCRNKLIFPHHRLVNEAVIDILKDVKLENRVLDIGCGDGFFLSRLRELGFIEIQGIDPSETFLSRCRDKGLSVEKKDLFDLKREPRFDLVLLIEVLEHLEEPRKAIEVIRSILREDGKLLLTVPVCDSFLKRYERFRYRLTRERQVRSIDETHIHAFSREAILRLTRDSGLRVLKCFYVSNPFPWVKRYCGLNCFYLLQRFSLGGRFGDYLIVFAGKEMENQIK
jgi:SAM-dependent methyltransferase